MKQFKSPKLFLKLFLNLLSFLLFSRSPYKSDKLLNTNNPDIILKISSTHSNNNP